MDALIIDRDKNTPYVNFIAETGLMEIKGSSIPEDTHKFYNPLAIWIEEYLKTEPKKITINLQFDYLNTSSSKWVLKILQLLAEYHYTRKYVTFNWYYDEHDIYDTGHYYQSLLNVEFNFIEYR
ncbi:MAG: DUF1987 domain-containing protein [Bacteroidia bacterium]|nr:DUF1987 domain-containing protein [Bacteroidia bacterium]